MYDTAMSVQDPPFDIKTLRGLSEKEAADRLGEEGYNELPSAKRRGTAAIAFEIVDDQPARHGVEIDSCRWRHIHKSSDIFGRFKIRRWN